MITTVYFHPFLPFIPGMIENMKRYQQLGIEVHMTEIDVSCKLLFPGPTCAEWTREAYLAQTMIYTEILTACLNAPNCKSFETWGWTDKYTWLHQAKDMNPLPFDKDFNKKSSFFAMIKILKEFPRDHEAIFARN